MSNNRNAHSICQYGHDASQMLTSSNGLGKGVRRRIMAILRLSSACVAFGRQRGLGALGHSSSRVAFVVPAALGSALALGIAAPSAVADTLESGGTCVSAGSGVVGNEPNQGNTTDQPADGSGTYSTVAGCNADGHNQLGVTVFGTRADGFGAGAVAVGYNADAVKWASAFGLDANASATGSVALGFSAVSSGANAVAIGSAGGDGTTPLTVANSTTASGAGAVAIGSNATRGAQARSANSIALGGEATVGSGATSGIAIGTAATANGNGSVVIGASAENAATITAVVIGPDATSISTAGVVIAHARNDELGVPTALTTDGATPSILYSVAVGDSAEAGNGGTAVGSKASAVGNGALALGAGTSASGTVATAVGFASYATGEYSQSFGYESAASGDFGTAIGSTSTASGISSVALGTSASATGEHAVAIGSSPTNSPQQDSTTNTRASGANSLALGTSAVAANSNAIAIGTGAEATGAQSISIGTGNQVSGDNSGAIGDPTTITGTGSYSLGNDNTIDADEAGVFGNNNVLTAAADGSRIIGNGNNVDVADAFVIGNGADATVAGGVALGSGSVAGTAAGVAGYDPVTGAPSTDATPTWQSTASAVAVGDAAGGVTRQITGVAAGTELTDAVNVAQLQAAQAAATTHYYSVNDGGVIGGNYNNDGATGLNALAAGVDASAAGVDAAAIGLGADASAEKSTAIGPNATASGDFSVAIGSNSEALGVHAVVLGADSRADAVSTALGQNANAETVDGQGFATAVGNSSLANQVGAVALGAGANATGERATALGADTTASGGYSVALGQNALATADRGAALGVGAQALAEGGIALGAGSIADTAAGVAGYDPLTGLGSTDPSSTWVSTLGAVSVGGAGDTRQITDVAAGTELTDAVNVAQLQAVESLATSGWNVTDGTTGANIGPDGTVTFTGDTNISVAQTGVDDNGAVEIALNPDVDLTAAGSLTVGDTLVDTNGLAVTDGVTTTAVGADGVTSGTVVLSGVSNDITGLGNTTLTDPSFGTVGRAATEEQLAIVNQTASAGWNVSAQGANATNVSVASATGADVDLNNADGNIEVTKATDSNDVTFDLADDITVDSMVAGNTTIDTDGLTIAGGPSVTSGGIDAGGTVISNVAPGIAGTDAVNLDQLQAAQAAATTHYYSVNDGGVIGGNYNNDGAIGTNSLAAGVNAQAQAADSVAIGLNSQTTDINATSIGAYSTTQGVNDTALGAFAAANGHESTALGAGSFVYDSGTGVGFNTSVEGRGVAVGHSASTVVDGTALGSSSSVTTAYGVALGSGSVASTAAGETGYVPTGALAGDAAAIAATDSTTLGAVSVGSAGNTRQITNVAAGTQDSDAVNVAQLQAVESLATSGWNVTDGTTGANIGPDGTVTFTGDTNISVAQTGVDDNGAVEIALNPDVDLTAAGSLTVGDTLVDTNGLAVTDGVTTTAVGADGVTSGTVVLSGVSNDITGLGNTTLTDPSFGTVGRAATEEQLAIVNQTASAGWNVSAQGANATNVSVASATGSDVDLNNADGNIDVTKAADSNDVTFDLASDLVIDNSITVGDTVIDGDSVTTTNLTVTGDTQLGDNFVVNDGGVYYDGPVTEGNHIVNKTYVDDSVTAVTEAGLNFADAAGNLVHVDLGGTLPVIGATTQVVTSLSTSAPTVGTYSSANVQTIADAATGQVQVQIADSPKFGDVTINDNGTGRITGVTAGTADTDAVNVAQLNEVSDIANAGWNVTAQGANGTNVGVNSPTGNSVDLNNSDGNIEVTKTADSNDVTFDLASDLVIDNSITVGDTIIDGDSVSTTNLTVTGDTQLGDNFVVNDGGVYYDGPVTEDNHIVNKSYVDESITTAVSNVNIGFAGNSGGAVTRSSGQVLTIQGEGTTAGDYSGANIRTVTDPATGSVNIEMAESPQFGNVTVNADGTGKITGVTAGELSSTSTDAVNGSQIVALGDSIASSLSPGSSYDPATNTINTQIAVGGNVYNNVESAIQAVNSNASAGWNVTTGATGSGVATGSSVANVAPGATASFTAGNNMMIHQNGTEVQVALNPNLTGIESIAIENGPTIDGNGIDMGGTRITNVGAGVAPTDAVNLGQLNAGLADTLNQANHYTDAMIADLRFDLSDYRSDANGGTASAMAMGMVPQAFEPGMGIMGFGISHWQGEQAIAVGFSKASDNGRFVIRATGTYNTRNQAGAAIGAGIQF
ncbi:YadA-like family protein [Pelagerythrobacter marensis]|uniref:YadA-like family protein n=1 Tax=Pelagerythrobacter marensis TaxID=543877 RepID=A0ABZ2D178_9SPHN